jgi:hypothetical protein
MTIRHIAALLLLVLMCACGAPTTRGDAATQDRAATWTIDDDANLAYPTCPSCGADFGRDVASCGKCGTRVHVEAKTIACPECHGSKTCVHCGPARPCVACEGTHVCPICDGTGKWHGDVCPECQGSKTCQTCVPGAPAQSCEFCGDTHTCANCEGTGTIALK